MKAQLKIFRAEFLLYFKSFDFHFVIGKNIFINGVCEMYCLGKSSQEFKMKVNVMH